MIGCHLRQLGQISPSAPSSTECDFLLQKRFLWRPFSFCRKFDENKPCVTMSAPIPPGQAPPKARPVARGILVEDGGVFSVNPVHPDVARSTNATAAATGNGDVLEESEHCPRPQVKVSTTICVVPNGKSTSTTARLLRPLRSVSEWADRGG